MNRAGLCALLDASLRQWEIGGRCEEGPDQDLGALIDLPEHGRVTIARVHPEGARLPVWRFAIGGRRPVEAVSIRQALKALRMELDPQYRPARAIIGMHPSVPAAGGDPTPGLAPSTSGDRDT